MKTIDKFILGSLFMVTTVITFSMTIKDNSLESLRANAKQQPTGNKCCPAINMDCMHPSTGNIYPGMRDC